MSIKGGNRAVYIGLRERYRFFKVNFGLGELGDYEIMIRV